MSRIIVGLDIGVSSVGAAVVREENGKKEIEKLSVRIVPEDPNFHLKFYSGNTASKNLERTEKRGIRRGYQRLKARKKDLYQALKENDMFPTPDLFDLTALELYGLRSTAVTEQISLKELGRVLILLNQRRGFLSNRKSQSEEENSTEYKARIAQLEKELNGKTIGQKLFEELHKSNQHFEILLRERTYQRSSYLEEFDRIWDFQKEFHPILTGGINEDDNTDTLYELIRNRIIYYQRPLKSQKDLVSECTFEKNHKAVTKSSPYFELYRIWQKINDLSWRTPNGETYEPTLEQKQELVLALWYGNKLNSKFKLTISEIKGVLGYKRNDKVYLNFPELDGSRTYAIIKKALEEAKVENLDDYLYFNPEVDDEKGGLFELWHITYSLPTEEEIINTLRKRFDFTVEQAEIIARRVGYTSDYGSLSTRAIRKLLPYLEQGKGYSEACDEVGYDHSGYKSEIMLQSKLKHLTKNELRNPVVEQILNQVVNVINLIIEEYGSIDEIRVELARELRNSAKTRQNISRRNAQNRRSNDAIRQRLKVDHGFKVVNGRDVKRFILWQEAKEKCLYCNNPIGGADMLNGNAEIEHVIPRTRSFSNAMSNFIIAHRKCNSDKGQRTAYDYMESKGEEALAQYIERVNELYQDGKGITKAKFDNLLCKGEDIPNDFVDRMKNDTQYIAKEAVKMLRTVCANVYTTTGQVTDFLRDEWELKHLLQELTFHKYEAIGQVEEKEIKTRGGQTKTIKVIKDWSKREDHRHHAVDALICALTDQKIIFKLNNLNKIYQYETSALTSEEINSIEEALEGNFTLKEFSDQIGNVLEPPIPNLRSEAKKHLENILVSFKKDNSKVLTKTINRPKNGEEQVTWVPRGRLHEDTVMGKIKRVSSKKMKLTTRTRLEDIETIVSQNLKELVYNHFQKFDNNARIAFSAKILRDNPLIYKDEEVKEVKVFEWTNTKRVEVSENMTGAQIKKIIDDEVRSVLEQRLKEHDGKPKSAFRNLDENSLLLKNGMMIKRVTVSDESKVESVRDGYVLTGGNHHALIYKDEKGKYNDKVVSFWEAVDIGLLNISQTNKPYPIINRGNDSEHGVFQFSMQRNDLFVFDLKHSKNPQKENEIDFFNVDNRKLISEKMFRLQNMSKKANNQFVLEFRHHLEATVTRNAASLKDLSWIGISKNSDLARLTKIRINHLGEIIKVGE